MDSKKIDRREFLTGAAAIAACAYSITFPSPGMATAAKDYLSSVKDKKSLIIYASLTGNTDKVARRMKTTFEKHGWKCDMFNIEDLEDPESPPFKFDDYDFLCAGSRVHKAVPREGMINLMRKAFTGPMEKIVPGPKCGIVFCTYAGVHLGPVEAAPTLKLLEHDVLHLDFKVIGEFCCPGKMGDEATQKWYHGDIRNRPNEEDLNNAETFITEVLRKLGESAIS